MRIISANAVAASVKLRLLSIIHPSIFCRYLSCSQGRRCAGARPSCLRVKAAFTLDKSPVCRRANTEQQTFTLTPADNSELKVGLNFSNANSNFVYWNNKINRLFSVHQMVWSAPPLLRCVRTAKDCNTVQTSVVMLSTAASCHLNTAVMSDWGT